MKAMLEQRLSRFNELEAMMASGDSLAVGGKIADVAREHGALARIALAYRDYKDAIAQIAELHELIETSGDADEREFAAEEIERLRADRERLWDELLSLTVGGEDATRTRCVLEIRAGTGGDEAALFARDLLEMYTRFCDFRGWKIELLDSQTTELGGIKHLTAGLEGEGVYRELQYESGVHRVQRVPETETKGRIHTSAATVAVLPEPEDVEIEVSPEDYRKDVFCASGPGGQHVNKTASAVRLTHHETGITVSMQDEKSQHQNMAKALRVLKSRLYDHFRQIEHAKRADARKSLVGSGDRSQRIRTYNYPENRVTHHTIGFKTNLDQIMAGNLQPLIGALLDQAREELRDEADL